MALTYYPNPKINLGLFIKGKLPNGYHLLETVFYPVDYLKDELTLSENAEFEFELSGKKIEGSSEDNLCYKAYLLVKEQVKELPNIKIQLTKHIPMGAGLGGGSADAACTILGLNELFGLHFSAEKMAEIGAKLGADVPFFIYNRPMFAEGTGTKLSEIALPQLQNYRIEIINPPIHSSTITAYKALNYKEFDHSRDLRKAISTPIENWKEVLDNDLEVPVFHLYPELRAIKESFYQKGAIYAAMSGSGSAVFGIFEK